MGINTFRYKVTAFVMAVTHYPTLTGSTDVLVNSAPFVLVAVAVAGVVMAAPGHTVLLIPNTIRKAGGKLGTYCDSSSLPFICRKSAPQRIKITRAAQIRFAEHPWQRCAGMPLATILPRPQSQIREVMAVPPNNCHCLVVEFVPAGTLLHRPSTPPSRC